ncbi:MAG TPA: GntR family transcriptional regulator [Steroidobacteraceae bacterium]|nr:GntR family transcriptional regulator [Steroidobacteraceae bacterium]
MASGKQAVRVRQPGPRSRPAGAKPGKGAPASRASATPRYHQVYVGVRAWVRDGTYRPGQQIPTEAELCDAFKVSRITVRKAVDELVREGWLVREQGRGTFVAMIAARAAASVDLNEALHYVADLGALTQVRNVRSKQVVPDEETRAALGLADGELVQRESHVRLLRGAPLGRIHTFVPLDIAARVERLSDSGVPMFELLRRAGVKVGEAEQWIGATLAGMETAKALGIDVGAPVLKLVRVVLDTRGRAVERVVAEYRAEAYVYRMHLAPTSAPARNDKSGSQK